MADAAQSNNLAVQTEMLLQSRMVRQLLLLVGLAGAVALGVVVALWSQTPDYAPLYAALGDRDAGEVVEALRAAELPYKLDDAQGTILVPRARLHEARLKLAAQGLPNGSAAGLEMLQKEQEIGTSQFMESARYHHALEVDLARTIASLRSVESVRVHLALPRQSVFVRNRVKPSASVLLKLFPGRSLESQQVAAIVHLVASSVPELEPGQVAVVDQMGRMLSEVGEDRDLALTARQYDLTRRLESDYGERVLNLLEPLVGLGRVRAQVTAELDFSRSESTQERFDPQGQVLRSEQINEQATRDPQPAQGIPGALSNQPPGAGTTDAASAAGEVGESDPLNQSRSAVRNFELDRVVSHTKQTPGAIRRLAVAVVVDEPVGSDEQGNPVREPYSDEQLAKFTELVRQAIGFDAQRGDSVSVVGSSFLQPELEALPELPWYEQSWVWDLGRLGAGAVLLLVILLLVVRPLIRGLTAMPATPVRAVGASAGAGDLAEDQVSLSGGRAAAALPPGATAAAGYEEKLGYARKAALEDPMRVANVVKTWVGADA